MLLLENNLLNYDLDSHTFKIAEKVTTFCDIQQGY